MKRHTTASGILLFGLVMILATAASAQWVPMPSGTTATLKGIWGFAPDDIFVVGYFKFER